MPAALHLDPHHPAHLLAPQAQPAAAPNAAERATHELCSLRTAQRVYEQEFAGCQKSPEWKTGALRGLRLGAGLAPGGCPYACCTAQADAWLDGNQAGLTEWHYRAGKGLL